MSRYRPSFFCTYCGQAEDDSWAFVHRNEGYHSDGESGDDENAYHEGGQCGKGCCGEANSDDDEREYHNRNLCGPTCHGNPSQADANARALLDAAVAVARVPPGTVDDVEFSDAYLQQLLLSYKRRYAQFCRHRPHYRETQLVPGLVWKKVYEDFQGKFPGVNFDSLLLKIHLRRALFASEPPSYEPDSPREYYNQPNQTRRKKKTAKQKAIAYQKFWWTRDRHKACTYCGKIEDDNWTVPDRNEGYQSDGESGDDENAYHEGGECGRGCCGEPNSSDDEQEYHNRKLCGPTCHGTPSQADANARALLDAALAAARVAPGKVGDVVFTDVYLQQLLVSFKRRHAQFCSNRPHYRENQLVPGLVWKMVYADFRSKFPGTSFDSLLLKTHLRRALYASNPPNYYSSSEREYYEQPDPATAPTPVSVLPVAPTRAPLPTRAPAQAPAPAVAHAPLSIVQAIALANTAPMSLAATREALSSAAPSSLAVRQAQAAALATNRAAVNAVSGHAAVPQVPAPVAPFAVATVAAAVHVTPTPVQASVVPDANLFDPGSGNGQANGAASSSIDDQTQASGPVIKSEKIDPAADMVLSAGVFAELVDEVSEFPLGGDSDHSATDTASSDTDEEGNENSNHLQSQSQQESRKRRVLENTVELQELKKRKLALENLKLAMELGIITREEGTEKGRQVVQE